MRMRDERDGGGLIVKTVIIDKHNKIIIQRERRTIRETEFRGGVSPNKMGL